MGVNGEALQLHAVYKFYYKSRENLYQYYNLFYGGTCIVLVVKSAQFQSLRSCTLLVYSNHHFFALLIILTES